MTFKVWLLFCVFYILLFNLFFFWVKYMAKADLTQESIQVKDSYIDKCFLQFF